MKEIRKKDGLWWPAEDYHCIAAMQSSTSDLSVIQKHCKGFNAVVQAGGNVGVWPLKMAQDFVRVYTFEPDETNFACLLKNTLFTPNIHAFNDCLGNGSGTFGLARLEDNCGAHYLVPNGDIPMTKIDALGLAACDLIQLDIEGYELEALKGAQETIKKFHPVIVCEEKGLGIANGFKIEPNAIREFLAQFGYKEVERVNNDVIYTA